MLCGKVPRRDMAAFPNKQDALEKTDEHLHLCNISPDTTMIAKENIAYWHGYGGEIESSGGALDGSG